MVNTRTSPFHIFKYQFTQNAVAPLLETHLFVFKKLYSGPIPSLFRWGNRLKERKCPAQSTITVQGSQNEPQNQLTSLPMWTRASLPWSIYMVSILFILAHDRNSLYLEIHLETQLMSEKKENRKKEKKSRRERNIKGKKEGNK